MTATRRGSIPFWAVLCSASLVPVPVPVPAHAADPSLPGQVDADTGGATRGPILPERLAPYKSHYFSVGVGVERFGRTIDDNEHLVGLAAAARLGPFSPFAALLAKAFPYDHADTRWVFAGGLRGYAALFGTELSYGVSAHAELRLEDHFWLGYATPLELGAVVFDKRSFRVEVFLGARRVFAGHLLNHFLIDPNGIDNENALDELNRQKRAEAWKGFFRLVFSRKID